jgi:ADP-glucose pyrophosphorylase
VPNEFSLIRSMNCSQRCRDIHCVYGTVHDGILFVNVRVKDLSVVTKTVMRTADYIASSDLKE